MSHLKKINGHISVTSIQSRINFFGKFVKIIDMVQNLVLIQTIENNHTDIKNLRILITLSSLMVTKL